jgi:hypothetical protein
VQAAGSDGESLLQQCGEEAHFKFGRFSYQHRTIKKAISFLAGLT